MSRGLMVALVTALLILAGGVAGLAGYFFLGPGAELVTAATPEQAQSEELDSPVSFLELQKFVTDLSDTDRLRYVDVTVVLGLTDEESQTAVKKIEPRIRDAILGQLRATRSADLLGSPGKDRLARSLEQQLTEMLKGHLKAIYITDLIVQ